MDMDEVKDYPPYLDYPKPHKPITNADRIRQMSDEELADEISRISILDLCDIVCGGYCKSVATLNKTSQQRCAENVLKWLQLDSYKRIKA